jgi:lipid II:glycine glycyltransferase (peptidoglycan interpeptide bridge formation enzyme)
LGGVYDMRVSRELEDPEWDDFLRATSGGNHVQTSLWAQVKASVGWAVTRVVVKHGGAIVAGGQILIRSLPLVGAVGYMPRGPVCATSNPLIARRVVEEIREIGKSSGLRYLVVQPPSNGTHLLRQLPDSGFQPTGIEVAPTATVLIDVRPDLETLIAKMKPRTRYNLRYGLRNGITFRVGTEKDISTFHRLLVATGRRQSFSPYPKDYFLRLWQILASRGHIQLFVAEYKGEAVCAQIAMVFGDTVIRKFSAWSGRHSKLRPNEVLEWGVIGWARAHGFHYYDLEGIEPDAAKSILRGEGLPPASLQTVTSFKLGLGGDVTVFPQAYDYVYNPILRRTYRTLGPLVSQGVIAKALNRVRTG